MNKLDKQKLCDVLGVQCAKCLSREWRFGSLGFWSSPVAPTFFSVFYPHMPTCLEIWKEKAICQWVGISIEGQEISLDVEDGLSWGFLRTVLFSTEESESEIRLNFGNYHSLPRLKWRLSFLLTIVDIWCIFKWMVWGTSYPTPPQYGTTFLV